MPFSWTAMASFGQKWLQIPQRLQRASIKTGSFFFVRSLVVTRSLYTSRPNSGAQARARPPPSTLVKLPLLPRTIAEHRTKRTGSLPTRVVSSVASSPAHEGFRLA
jgi:hypothetical protein